MDAKRIQQVIIIKKKGWMADKEEVVEIKVFDKKKGGGVVFDGAVSTDVAPGELVHLRCFVDRLLEELFDKSMKEQVESFKGIVTRVELMATYGMGFNTSFFSGVLYIGYDDGVLRKSKSVPSIECRVIAGWYLEPKEAEKVFVCETLEELELSCCQLSQIPQEMGKMTKLKKLKLHSLSGCTSIPDEMGQLSNLKDLMLSDLMIESLPQSIAELHQLEKLTLVSLSHLERIPEDVGKLSRLKSLIISNCVVIQRLPNSMKDLMRLQSLALNFMPQLHICSEDFVVLSKLKQLQIISCNILWMPWSMCDPLDAFCGMLKQSVCLCSIRFDIHGQKEERMIREAFAENGSIVEGEGNVVHGGISDIFERNKSNHDRAMAVVICMMAIKRFKQFAVTNVPKEIMQMIAEMVWTTRCDFDAWF